MEGGTLLARTRLKTPSNPRRDRDLAWLARLKETGRQALEELPPPQGLFQALEEFNRREFFQCHDTLEELWLKETYPIRLFYQGILKVAVGFHHLQRHNQRGAGSKISEGLDLLEPFAPRFMGVEVGKLRADAGQWLQKLSTAVDGPVPDSALPKISYRKPGTTD